VRDIVRAGTLVDATVIPSASIKDEEARWARHRRRKPVHCYKAHVPTDQEADVIHGVDITIAKARDDSERATIMPDTLGDTFGDSPYQGTQPERIIHAQGGTPRVVNAGRFGGAAERLRTHIAAV
jgi:IS5 family transposase